MIKNMWRCLFYFLVAVAISCGKYNGQLGMKSREKTALKVTAVAKNAAEELPNQPKKKKKSKRKSQPKDTWWDRWINFCRFFFPIILLTDSVQAQCPIKSCGLFKGYGNEGTVISPFTLRVNDSLNKNYVEQLLVNYRKTMYDTVNFWSYPEEIREEACHLFSDRDVDITHTVDTSNGTQAKDTTKCFNYSQELKQLFKHTINDILDKRNLWDLHYEKAESKPRKKPNECRLRISRIGNNGKLLSLYPALVEKKKRDNVSEGYTWDVHTWRENKIRGKTDFRSFDLRKKLDDGKIRGQYYYSPQNLMQ
ncbi:hypothetical protein [Candidatus Cardinium hertigii]|uniref:Lipoprotein n=1 Tax=Candidatus Cardinium hertigii TaxID=247481 RepID=A0A2Z3LCW3_9BACT|nr:hypothetical protein [Candidatus Cardinium hertigii]AWN82012.1 hypothetical protein DK880_00701 [Candidatus Cardinium hertigii]